MKTHVEDYPELAAQFEFDKIAPCLRSRPFDTEDLYDKVLNALLQSRVPQEAWNVDCDEAAKFFSSYDHETLQSIQGSDSEQENVRSWALNKYGKYKLDAVSKACRESHTFDELRTGLMHAYKLAYCNVMVPEKVVRHSPPILAKTLELYVFTFGLTDFLLRVEEERDRMRHSRTMTVLRDLSELQLSGANCKDGDDVLMYLKRVKPAFYYVARFYSGTPLGDSFNACVVAKALEAVERRVPQLQMPYKLSTAYDRAVMGGDPIDSEEAIQLLTDVSNYMNQNETLFRHESLNGSV